jgi:hypothetical protein
MVHGTEVDRMIRGNEIAADAIYGAVKDLFEAQFGPALDFGLIVY